MMPLSYGMDIIWSEEDRCYVVHLLDFLEQKYRTHDNTYEETARNGREILELSYQKMTSLAP